MAKPAYRKTEPNLAAIYARVSDKSQDAEDKTSISEQISDMESHCQRRGADRRRPLPGGGQGVVEEAPRVPEDAGRRQAGTLRHHRLLEVRPPQPGHVPRRSAHGGRRGPPHQPPSRHGRHRYEDLRSHGRRRQDRAGQLQGALFHGQAQHGQAGPHPHQQRPLRLLHRRGRQAGRSWKPRPRWCAASTGRTSAMERERPPSPGS